MWYIKNLYGNMYSLDIYIKFLYKKKIYIYIYVLYKYNREKNTWQMEEIKLI